MTAITNSVSLARSVSWLDQPAVSFIQLCIFAAGAMFWVEAYQRPEAFSSALYGELALRLPAEIWAGVMMGAAAMVWIGLMNPPKRWMVAFGGVLQTAQFLSLSYSAIATNGEPIIGYWCSVFFAPIYARLTWEAFRNA